MSEMHRNFIGGDWMAGAESARNINPSDLSAVIGEYAGADKTQADSAIAAARAAFPAWSMSSVQDRANFLDTVGNTILARKDELGRLLSREEGKTLPEGIGEVVRAGQIFKFFGGEALRLAGEKIQSIRPGVDVEITRDRGQGDRAHGQAATGNGRQESSGRARRRGPGRGRELRGQRCVLLNRTALHRVVALDRRRQYPRPFCRRVERAPRIAQGR